LAIIALQNKERILRRNLDIIAKTSPLQTNSSALIRTF